MHAPNADRSTAAAAEFQNGTLNCAFELIGAFFNSIVSLGTVFSR